MDYHSLTKDIHGLDLHATEELPSAAALSGLYPFALMDRTKAVPAQPVQPSRPPVMVSAVVVDYGTLVGTQRGGGLDQHGVGHFRVRRRPGRPDCPARA